MTNLKIRGISLLTAAFTIVSLSGCANVKNDSINETTSINIEKTNSEEYNETIIIEETISNEYTEATTSIEETIPEEYTETVSLDDIISKDYPEGFTYISQEGNTFNEYCKKIIVDGEEVLVYRGFNVFLTIDEKTYEVKEYIYNKGAVTDKVYDLATGYMLVDGTLISFPEDEEVINWDKIIEGNHIFDFAYIDDYLENPEYKEWYTLEEIKELEQVIVDALKVLLNDNSKVK